MQDIDTQQFLLDILERAETGKVTDFQLLRNLTQYRFCKDQRRSLDVLVTVLQRAANQLFSSYCKAVSTGTADVNQLLAYKQLIQTIEFYKRDREVFKDMTQEYEAFLSAGHFLSAILGESRSFEDLHDFRGE